MLGLAQENSTRNINVLRCWWSNRSELALHHIFEWVNGGKSSLMSLGPAEIISADIFLQSATPWGGKKGALVHNLHHVGSKTNWPQPSVYLMPSPTTDLRRLFFHVCGNCPKLQEHRLPKIAVSAPWSVHFVQELNKRACWTKTRGLLLKWIQPLEQAQQLCNASFWGQISWFRTAIFWCWWLMLEEGWISPFASRRAMNPVRTNAGVSLHSLCARGPAHTLVVHRVTLGVGR